MANRCAITNSATLWELAAGVLKTTFPWERAYSTSMLSMPTPPRPMKRSSGQASMRSWRTLVALRTRMPA